ncbi:MAG: hypothetical protein M1837_003843 [Sclerophora amabilis]|nr:MAG: hypothetical protein M1837_003843 [Sclerophora amabilis]
MKEILLEELSLLLLKRQCKDTTENDFVYLGTQLWGSDWHVYELPGNRVDLWSEIQLYAFTSARAGEYLELASRPGSDRGLYYRDNITFGAFQNELDEVEFAAQVARDAKGLTTCTPDKKFASRAESLVSLPNFC